MARTVIGLLTEVGEKDGAAVFYPVRPPTTEEVAEIAAKVAARVHGLLERHGLAEESDDSGAAALDAAQGAALFGGVASLARPSQNRDHSSRLTVGGQYVRL